MHYPESYSSEDIQQILQVAIARRQNKEELSREQLWEIASELDIDRSSIETAERDWLEQKAIAQKRQEFNLYRRQTFQQRLTKYLIINTFLVSFNLLLAGVASWSLYVMLFWGLALALNGWKAYQTQGADYERAFQRWSFQNEVKQTFVSLWDKLQKAWQI
ncbi:2TM domain-containing protein [Myxosarcina sp. GI1]|uniref:2TM domain-containing protein n=1 Tax=Myxosarcina sp. GI1 TaxID=1541065 RepID=UPI00055B257D|nr:2TM domain-containing protein [Myxosarcina sp. GI1]